MVTEQSEALTVGKARAIGNVDFSNLKWHLEQGKWVNEPHLWTAGFNQYITWSTKGTGTFGGTEFGHVEVDLKYYAREGHATLSWYNPDRGANSCGIKITGPYTDIFRGACEIDQGAHADAKFVVGTIFNGPVLRP